MTGNVFISWSGERSQKVGELLKWWLPAVIQRCEPWISTEIDRGAIWFQEISGQLSDSSIGIICLTRENLNAPWILFEAGALAKGLSQNRVCPLLIDLESSETAPPLSQFNHTQATKAGLLKLVETLNRMLKGTVLAEETLHKVFERMWPDFEAAFQEILSSTPATPAPAPTSETLLTNIYETVQRTEKMAYLALSSSSRTGNQKFDLPQMKESVTVGEAIAMLYRTYLALERSKSSERSEPSAPLEEAEEPDGYCGDCANDLQQPKPGQS